MGPDVEERWEEEGLPEVALADPDGDLLEVLREAQFLLLRQPVAAQAVFAAFVAEGRRFGQTAEGRDLARRLAGSDLIRKGRVVWEIASMKMLEEGAPAVLPSAYAEAFAQVTRQRPLEPLLARLFDTVDEVDSLDRVDGDAA